MTLLGAAASSTTTTSTTTSGGRLLLFEDDFEFFDASKWNIDLRAAIPTEEEVYTDREVNVRCENSTLILQAWRENYADRLWTSGQVNTIGKYGYLYGRFEARLRMDRGRGLWPAWWLIDKSWNNPYEPALGKPTPTEIDLLEALNTNPFFYSTLHFGPTTPSEQVTTYTDLTEYHVYAVEWTPTSLTFSLDGVDYWTRETSVFNVGVTMLLNLALGGWAGPTNETTPDGSKMEIDWVRVWAPVGDSVERVPTSISLSRPSSIAFVGQPRFETLGIISPANAHNHAMWWTSSDPSVAIVGGGWITSLSPGTTTITATTWNGLSASMVHTVVPA